MLEQITDHVYRIDQGASLGFSLAMYLITLPEELVLIDAGFTGALDIVKQTLEELGRRPEEISNILVTHSHPDHAGGLAELKRATGARVWMSPEDASLVRVGEAYRPWTTSPGEHNRIYVEQIIKQAPTTLEPCAVDREIAGDGNIPVAGGIQAIPAPGHTAGHTVFFWPQDRSVLFMGDAAKNDTHLEPATIHEDYAQGLDTLRMLGASYEFEVACFAHGAPILEKAAEEFRRTWP